MPYRFSARTATKLAVLCLVISTSVSVAHAADRDFAMIVNHIKRHYKASPTKSFSMGLAGLFVKMAHPAGVKSVQLAVFEDLGSQQTADPDALDDVLREGLGEGWNAVVRVSSRRDGELTRIFIRPVKNDFELLIVTIDGRDATVLKAKVSPESLGRWISNHGDFDEGNSKGLDW
jgi:hypothetical protein